LGITNKVLYYRESGTSGSTQIGNDAISLSTFAGDKTYQIFAKDDGGNETVFKTLKFVADGTAPNVTYTYEFLKDGVTDIANYYTVEDPDANGIIVIKYNPDKLNGGKYKVTVTCSETPILKKIVNNGGEQPFNNPGEIELALSNGDSIPVILTAYDTVSNANIFAKFTFTADNTLGVSNGGNSGGTDPNGNIRGSGFSILQALAAGKSNGSIAYTRSFVPPVEVQEIVSTSTKAADSEKSAALKKVAAKQTSKKKSKVKTKSAVQVQAAAVVEKAATQVQEVLPDVAPIEAATSAPEAVTLVSSVTSEASVVEPQAALSGASEDIISVAQPEKSTSKAALIVIMLAILSAAAGAWYLRKSRK
jgi:hypothetical protein